MLGRALTYLVLYSTLGMMVRTAKVLCRADPSSDGHGVSSSSREPTKKSRKCSQSPFQLLELPTPTPSQTPSKSCRPNRSSHTLAPRRPIRSLPLPTECHEMNVIKKETLLEVWIGSGFRNLRKGLDRPSLLFHGLLELHPLTRCRLQEWFRGEDPIGPIGLEVSLLCRGRCLGRIAEGSFGDCQRSPNVSGSHCQWRKRIAVMMILTISMRTRNG
jgi:hypothetical protein